MMEKQWKKKGLGNNNESVNDIEKNINGNP